MGQLLKPAQTRSNPLKPERIFWTIPYLAWPPNLQISCKKRYLRAPQSKTGKRFFRIFFVQVAFHSGTLRCLKEAPTSSRTSYWGFALPLELSLSRGPELGSPTSDLPQFAPPARSEKMKNTPKFGKIRRIPTTGRKRSENGRKRSENGRNRSESVGIGRKTVGRKPKIHSFEVSERDFDRVIIFRMFRDFMLCLVIPFPHTQY